MKDGERCVDSNVPIAVSGQICNGNKKRAKERSGIAQHENRAVVSSGEHVCIREMVGYTANRGCLNQTGQPAEEWKKGRIVFGPRRKRRVWAVLRLDHS